MNVALAAIALVTLLFVCSLLLQSSQSLVLSALVAVALVQGISLFVILRVRGRVNDIQFSISLEHSLRRLRVTMNDYFYDGAAGTPSLQLHILKIVAMTKPRKVLELGSGQTTRLLSALSRKHPEMKVTTLEQNAEWWETLNAEVSHAGLRYVLSDLETRRVRGRSGIEFKTTWYASLPPEVESGGFDLIVVDGPDDGLRGTEFSEYARAGLAWYLPQILSDSFVIIFDDADLYKHQMAIELVKRELTALNIKYGCARVYGVKDQELIFSPRFGFLASI